MVELVLPLHACDFNNVCLNLAAARSGHTFHWPNSALFNNLTTNTQGRLEVTDPCKRPKRPKTGRAERRSSTEGCFRRVIICSQRCWDRLFSSGGWQPFPLRKPCCPARTRDKLNRHGKLLQQAASRPESIVARHTGVSPYYVTGWKQLQHHPITNKCTSPFPEGLPRHGNE